MLSSFKLLHFGHLQKSTVPYTIWDFACLHVKWAPPLMSWGYRVFTSENLGLHLSPAAFEVPLINLAVLLILLPGCARQDFLGVPTPSVHHGIAVASCDSACSPIQSLTVFVPGFPLLIPSQVSCNFTIYTWLSYWIDYLCSAVPFVRSCKYVHIHRWVSDHLLVRVLDCCQSCAI
jgi:hypothetical protein